MTIVASAGCDPREGSTWPQHPSGLRRSVLGVGLAALLAPSLVSASGSRTSAPARTAAPVLDRAQSQHFREWMTVLIHTQIERGPTPRWTHRDCAGLVRFAVAESLREHDVAWKRANGLTGTRVPPDLDAQTAAPLRNAWRRVDGTRAAFVGALELVQENTRFVSRELAQAAPGDLLFYDMGDEQHLMVWMGAYVAYHTGHIDAHDNGLRAIRPGQLLAWNDTRWRPAAENPNFTGLHRLDFLS